MQRRHFILGTFAGTLTTAGLSPHAVGAWLSSPARSSLLRETHLHIACNEYPWGGLYARQGRQFRESLAESLNDLQATGVNGFEPLVDSLDWLNQLAPGLESHGIQMRSLYVNSTLHDETLASQSIDRVMEIATRARELADTRIIVTNPSPIRWGGTESKSDRQLVTQASGLERLGKQLRDQGQVLAYHNHDVELKHAAREFHHMLTGTDPGLVKFCLDAHWVYRGSGDSNVALFDVVKLYRERIVELHLRQSRDGIWTETFGEGDIPYARLVDELASLPSKPHLVLEQAIEAQTPKTLDAVAAHQRSVESARDLFTSW